MLCFSFFIEYFDFARDWFFTVTLSILCSTNWQKQKMLTRIVQRTFSEYDITLREVECR